MFWRLLKLQCCFFFIVAEFLNFSSQTQPLVQSKIGQDFSGRILDKESHRIIFIQSFMTTFRVLIPTSFQTQLMSSLFTLKQKSELDWITNFIAFKYSKEFQRWSSDWLRTLPRLLSSITIICSARILFSFCKPAKIVNEYEDFSLRRIDGELFFKSWGQKEMPLRMLYHYSRRQIWLLLITLRELGVRAYGPLEIVVN